MGLYRKFCAFTNRYKVVRGMLAYSVLWPTGCLIQQTFEGRDHRTYDYKRCFKFSLYGVFVHVPLLYTYMRHMNKLLPKRTWQHSIGKAVAEQILFEPFSIPLFLFSMSLLEEKTIAEAKEAVHTKFFPTYCVGLIYWPIVQSFNFGFVPVKNQVIVISVFSVIWTTLLSYIQSLQLDVFRNKVSSVVKHLERDTIAGKDEAVGVFKTGEKEN